MIAFDEPPTRCPEGTRLAYEWFERFLTAFTIDAFLKRPTYEAHLATCEQCQAYEKWRDE